MAKTYNTFTNVSTGDVLTATNFNNVLTNIAGYRVPPACEVRRTTNLTSYVGDAAITWESAAYDTESPSDPMWASGSATRITIQTNGIYLVTFTGRVSGSATITLANPRIFVNGNTTADQYTPIFSATDAYFTIATTLSLVDNDYLTAHVGVVGGSAYVISGNSTKLRDQTRMTVTWLGQVS